jgi:ABC-type transporter Mla subunit MlaD
MVKRRSAASRRSLANRVTDSFRVLTELDLSHAYERQAGTVALVLLGVLVVALLVATGGPSGERGRVRVDVELPAAPGLARGDPVLTRGVRVGRVEGVRLLSPGHVQVTLSVDEAHAPRTDAGAQLVALDLIGNQAVQYEPGQAADPLAPGESVLGVPSVLFSDRLTAVKEQAAELVVGLREVDPEALAAEVERTRRALARARAAAAAFPADSFAAAVRASVARGDSVMAAFGDLRAAYPRAALDARRDSLAVSTAALFEQVGEVQGRLDHLRAQLTPDGGNVGRLTGDSTFRRELDAARASLRALLARFGGRRPAAPPP